MIARVKKPILIGIVFGLGHVHRFEDYPADSVCAGKPAEPVLVTPDERRFRTVVRRGVTKGWGVEMA